MGKKPSLKVTVLDVLQLMAGAILIAGGVILILQAARDIINQSIP